MGLYQRRRPSPIRIVPKYVRRQAPAEGVEAVEEGPESPDSVFSSPSTAGVASAGPDSPDSPSPTQTTFPEAGEVEGEEPPSPTEAPAQVSSGASSATAPAATSQASQPSQAIPPPPPPPPSSTQALDRISSSAEASSATPQPASSPLAPTREPSSRGTSAPAAQITQGSSATEAPTPSITTTVVPDSQFSSKKQGASAEPSSSVTAQPSSTGTALTPAQSELAGEGSAIGSNPTQKGTKKDGPTMSVGAEAALISLSVLGFIALVVGLVLFFKRQRRKRHELSMRHAEDAFNPSNVGSLHAPETVHTSFDPDNDTSHLTKSSTTSTSLFGAAHYERPETVSSGDGRSRIAPPQPTPNPFADPPLSKAYEQLRGRPVSTTLTNRESWLKNPFKDPSSERFDPFGELQEKARIERVRYVEELRREEEERQYREKEAMGLGLPEAARKGSGVTVEGLGVLDRSGSGGYR